MDDEDTFIERYWKTRLERSCYLNERLTRQKKIKLWLNLE